MLLIPITAENLLVNAGLRFTAVDATKCSFPHSIHPFHITLITNRIYLNFCDRLVFTMNTSNVNCKSEGKGKAVQLQAWSDPEGSRKLRFPDFMTTTQDGGKVVSLTNRPPLPPGNTPGTHLR